VIRSAMTRLLCMRLGTGQPGATLVTCILRDGSPRTQADMWSSWDRPLGTPPPRQGVSCRRRESVAEREIWFRGDSMIAKLPFFYRIIRNDDGQGFATETKRC